MMEKLQPKLRFPEFDENLQFTAIGNVCDLTTGNKDTQNKSDNGLYPFYVRSQTIERINSYSYDGEAILTSGDGVGVGKNYHYINGKFDYHQRVYCLYRFKDGIHGKYVFHYFSENFYKRITRMSAKNSVDSVRRDMIFDMPISIPSLPEQQKVASFLTTVDDKINNLKQKVSLLEKYKKGVMQQIFSQQIRFKDTAGNDYPEWEEKSLGEVVIFLKGKGLPKNEIKENGKFKCIHYGELFTKYNELISQVMSFTNTDEGIVLSHKNDVLMPTSDVTPNGLATASCLREDNVILGGDILIIRQKKQVFDGQFFSYYVKQHRDKVMKLVSGSTVYHLYGSDMAKFKICLPKLEEQHKIVFFLTNIDKKIETTKAQLSKMEVWKKGLLQGMFC